MRLSKALLISFEAEFGPHKKEIAQLYQEVRDEATLASKQAQKHENELQARERSEARRHRKILVKLRDNIHESNEENKNWRLGVNRRRLEKTKSGVLDVLSTYDYQKAYKQIRKECAPGTSNWLFKNSEFKTWKEGTSKTLWYSGRCKSLVVSSTLAMLIVENSRVREIGYKVQLFMRLHCKETADTV